MRSLHEPHWRGGLPAAPGTVYVDLARRAIDAHLDKVEVPTLAGGPTSHHPRFAGLIRTANRLSCLLGGGDRLSACGLAAHERAAHSTPRQPNRDVPASR